ncbi:MAG: hypothetical protein IH985_07115 [Planctomycetes bacterium]|nr:hypothetical protein [Planctomycetota bacterium]
MQSLILANASAAFYQGVGIVVLGIPVISAVEFLILAIMFRPKILGKLKLLVLVVFANYVSLLAGGAVLHALRLGLDEVFASIPIIDRAWPITLLLLSVALFLSILIEWPIVHRSLSRQTRSIRRTLAAMIVANLISFVGVVYLHFGILDSATFYTQFERAQSLDFVGSSLEADIDDYWVYYRALDGDIRRIRLDGTEDELFEGLEWVEYVPKRYSQESDFLFFLRIDGANPSRFCEQLIYQSWAFEPRVRKSGYRTAPFRDLREQRERVHVGVNFHGNLADGMYGSSDLQLYSMVFRNPFYAWAFGANGAAILPGHLVVLHLGHHKKPSRDDVILVVDVERKLIGLLAHGRQPFVVQISIDSDTPDPTEVILQDIP